MNCELFSIRGNQEEINHLNENLGNIVSQLSSLDIQLLFKTEVDRGTSKIEEAIIQSVNDQSSPELIIIANALDKDAGADFASIFSKIIYNWETRCQNSLPVSERGKKLHVKIFPIEDLNCGYRGYCFTIYNTRIVVLPRETSAEQPVCQLICRGVSSALNKFSENSLLFPDGFDHSENPVDIESLMESEDEALEEFRQLKESAGYASGCDAYDNTEGISDVCTNLSDNDQKENIYDSGENEIYGSSDIYLTVPKAEDSGFEYTDTGFGSQTDGVESSENAVFENNSPDEYNIAETENTQTASQEKSGYTGYWTQDSKTDDSNENIEFVGGTISKRKAKKLEKTRKKENRRYEKAERKREKRLEKIKKKEEKHAAKKQKKGFFRRNFPCRGDRPGEVIRKSIILVAFVTIIVCVSMIVNEMVILPAQNERLQNEIQNIFYSTPQTTRPTGLEVGDETPTSNDDPEEETSYNWDALKDINSEIIGWITIDNTVIDYPVLCHEDDPPGTTDPYYLHHNYANQWDSYGAIFTDPTSYSGLDTKNIALHGHHMNNGSMFGNLVYYGTGFADGNGTPYVNMDFYKSSPVVHFNTPEWNADWKIIAVIHTNALESHGEFFNYLQGNFSSDEEFLNFVYNVRERSIIDTDVDVNEDDQLITLSTCTYEFENFRTAVIARRVRPGEDSSVNVDNASVNTDMIWPDVYYWTFGGSKPESKTFEQAYNDGEISWYDGELYS